MDLTVVAIPAYFGGMGAEYLYLKRTQAERGVGPGDYERNDTIASLSMGVASLLAPAVMGRVLAPVTPGKGRWAKALVGVAAGAAVVTTVADVVARARRDGLPEAGVVPDRTVGDRIAGMAGGGMVDDGMADDGMVGGGTFGRGRFGGEKGDVEGAALGRAARRRRAELARKVASSAGATAIVAGGVAAATAWSSRTTGRRLYGRRLLGDRGTGPAAVAGAILAWDFVYYWNHRLAHESRYGWAVHVVHHSSEHDNLSTALRQPVADALTASIPYGALALLGYRPEVIETARGVNLLYQFWIHTEAIRSIGPLEQVLNSPSLHRVHHGSNRRYLDRNHGSILIVWDRLFGTHQVEDEPVVYGLTRNIETCNPARIATHELADIVTDVAASTTWRDRLSFVLRGPGWAYARRAERAVPEPVVAAGVA